MDDASARLVLAGLGLGAATIDPVGSGLSSQAWLVRDGGAAYVLRLPADDAPVRAAGGPSRRLRQGQA